MRFAVLLKIGLALLGIFLVEHVFTQQVARINPVVVDNGDTLQMAFAGGLDAPQFSFADLDRDGIEDLFVFDRVGDVAIPFLFDGPSGTTNYHIDWTVLDRLPKLQLWVLMRDFNGDGVEDIFAATSEPGVQGIDVYRGREEAGQLAFEKMTFDLGSFDVLYVEVGGSYTPIYTSWIDVPSIEDIDGDGDLDILTFEPGGVFLPYHKNLAVEKGLGLDTFDYDIADICWGKFKEDEFSEEVILSSDPNKCAGSNIANLELRHSGSALTAYDHDNDGDLDLVLGDLASQGLTFLLNGGTIGKAFMTEQINQFPSTSIPVDIPYFVSPFILDIDHDGLFDLIAASNSESFSENYNAVWYYQNRGEEGAPDLKFVQSDLFISEMLDFGSEARPTVMDVDADGLMDIIVGTGGYYVDGLRDPRLIYLRNVGQPDSPEFEVIDKDFLGFSAYASLPTANFAPEAGDLDGDGDVDLIIGDQDGQLFFVENEAGANNPAQFADPVYPYMDIFVGGYSTPAIVDINGDGLNDLVVGERLGNNDNMGRCSNLNYFQNVGTTGVPAFGGNPTEAPNTQCLGRVLFNNFSATPEFSAPEFYRTQEGLQMITGSEDGALRVYSDVAGNTSGAFTRVDTAYGEIADGFRTVPELADLNGDGYFEMIIGNARGGLTAYSTDLEKDATPVERQPTDNIQVKVWPNPASNRVYISLAGQVRDYTVEVFDALGKRLYIEENARDFNMGSFASGTYLFRISAENWVATEPVVIVD